MILSFFECIDGNSIERAWEEVKIPMPWGHVSGKWYGDRNKQPTLAIHGWLDNAGSFDRLIPLLSHRLPVLSIDLPGHGHSSHFPNGMHYHLFWDYIAVVRRIVKHFNWQSIKLIGHSMGGAVCFMYAASFREEVEQIILIDIYGPLVRPIRSNAFMTGPFIDKILALELIPSDKQARLTYDEWLAMITNEASIDRDSARILLKRSLNESIESSADKKYTLLTDPTLKFSVMGLFTLENVLCYAELIKCNVLNIRAVPGMIFDISEAYSKVINVLKKNTNLEYHEVDGEHHIHLQSPERIAKIINTFLLNGNQE